MRYNSYVASLQDVEECAAAGIAEVLIEPALLSRCGTLDRESAERLAHAAADYGLRPVLVWDILVTESRFRALIRKVSGWDLQAFAALRIQDCGVASWAAELRSHPVQFLVEMGSANCEALLGWSDLLGPALERLVVSSEIPGAVLCSWLRTIPVAVEILGAGQLSLFYSPRLLAPAECAPDPELSETLTLHAATTQSSGKPLRAFFHLNGTTLFHAEDLFLLDESETLGAAGLEWMRLDIRHESAPPRAAQGLTSLRRGDRWCAPSEWPRPVTRHVFDQNGLTTEFSKLKNRRQRFRPDDAIAEIIAVQRPSSVVALASQAEDLTQPLAAILPSGEEIEIATPDFRDITGAPVAVSFAGQVLVSGWFKGVVAGTYLRRVE